MTCADCLMFNPELGICEQRGNWPETKTPESEACRFHFTEAEQVELIREVVKVYGECERGEDEH